MAILKIKDETGKFVDIPAIQGAPGKDGAIQYEAGENITIDGNVISASGGIGLNDVKEITGELNNLSTEDKSSLVGAINEALINSIDSITIKDDDMNITQDKLNISYNARTAIVNAINKNLDKALLINIYCLTYDISLQFIVTVSKPTNSVSSQKRVYGLVNYRGRLYIWEAKMVIGKNGNTGLVTSVSFTPEPLVRLSTIDYVNSITGDLTTLATEDKSSLVNAINEAMNSGRITELTGDITINDLELGLYIIHGNYTIFYRDNIQADNFSNVYSDMNNRILIVGSGDYGGSMYRYGILLDGSYIKVFRADLCRKYQLMYSNILTLNNTNSYTPTSDYNPATKKYVDDAIASAITTSLEASY